jgi:hypothetical protein
MGSAIAPPHHLTRLITTYLGQLPIDGDPMADASTVKRLSGSLSQKVSEDEYRQYLAEKHGRSN